MPDDLTHYAPPLDFRQRSVTPRRFANWWCGWVSMSSMGPQRCFVHCWFSAGVITAAVTWPVPALAAPLGDSTDNTLNVNGIVISSKLYATTKPKEKQPK